eukprot:SAG11_NODE_17064_length_529_cov_2.030233_1_plen_95_part_00
MALAVTPGAVAVLRARWCVVLMEEILRVVRYDHLFDYLFPASRRQSALHVMYRGLLELGSNFLEKCIVFARRLCPVLLILLPVGRPGPSKSTDF